MEEHSDALFIAIILSNVVGEGETWALNFIVKPISL